MRGILCAWLVPLKVGQLFVWLALHFFARTFLRLREGGWKKTRGSSKISEQIILTKNNLLPKCFTTKKINFFYRQMDVIFKYAKFSETDLRLLQHPRWRWNPLTIIRKSSILDVAAVLDPPLILRDASSLINSFVCRNKYRTWLWLTLIKVIKKKRHRKTCKFAL